MAGLEGFTQGFQMADGFIRGREQNARANTEQQMRKENYDIQKTAAQRKLDKDFGTQLIAAKMNGINVDENDPQVQDFYKRNPMMKFDHLADDKTIAATDYAQGLAEGKGTLFSDETAQHLDALYQPLIQKDDGLHRRVSGIFPGKTPDTVVLDLEVTDADGNKRHAPMTQRRSADADDEIMQIPIADLVNTAQATRSLQSTLAPAIQARRSQQGGLSANELAYARAIGMAPQTKSYEQVDGPDGSVMQRDQDGKLYPVLGRAPVQRGTAQQQNFDFLRANGMSDEQAYQAAFKPSLGRQGSSRATVSPADRELQTLEARQKFIDEHPDSPLALKLGNTGNKTTSPTDKGKWIQGVDEDGVRYQENSLTGERKAGVTAKAAAAAKAEGQVKISAIDNARLKDINAQLKGVDKNLEDNAWTMSDEEKKANQSKSDALRAQKESIYGKYDGSAAQQDDSASVRIDVPAIAAPKRSAPLKTPNPGEVINGFKYHGGDPARQSNWSKI
jgi:hypothetical protein